MKDEKEYSEICSPGLEATMYKEKMNWYNKKKRKKK
jgi:hypothetical protein